MTEPEVSIAQVVFDPSHEASVARRRTLFVLAVVTSLVAHLLLLVATRRADPSLEQWSAELAVLIHNELTEQAPFQLAEPDPPPLPAAPPPPPAAPPLPRPPARTPTAVSAAVQPEPTSEPPVQAAAGEVIAAEPSAAAPVDLTGNTFVTGEASAYAGGSTASDGTSTAPVEPGPAETDAAASVQGAAPGPDLSRPVRPLARAWNCRWPDAAVDQQIYEQVVLIRVTVAADGSLIRTRVLRDPGHGFGPAARACAAQHRYEPARGRDGQPRAAESAPIRVRFRR